MTLVSGIRVPSSYILIYLVFSCPMLCIHSLAMENPKKGGTYFIMKDMYIYSLLIQRICSSCHYLLSKRRRDPGLQVGDGQKMFKNIFSIIHTMCKTKFAYKTLQYIMLLTLMFQYII